MHEDSLAKLMALCLSRLRQKGQWVRADDDLGGFERRMAALGKLDNHPMISVSWSDFATNDAFGLYIYSNGAIIGGLAARRVELGRDTLAKHWSSSYSRLYNNGRGAPVHSQVMASVKEISGTVVYLGELYLVEGQRSGKVDLTCVLHYMHCLGALKWRPDWIYGFVRQDHVLSGRAAQYGFTRTYPCAQEWTVGVDRRGEDEYLVAIAFEELCEAAGIYVRNPHLFAPKRGGRGKKAPGPTATQ